MTGSNDLIGRLLQGMIDLILATDMSRHSALMSQWTAILDSGFDYTKEDHRNMVGEHFSPPQQSLYTPRAFWLERLNFSDVRLCSLAYTYKNYRVVFGIYTHARIGRKSICNNIFTNPVVTLLALKTWKFILHLNYPTLPFLFYLHSF